MNNKIKKDNYTFIVSGDSISRGIVYDEQKGKYTFIKESYVSIVENNIKGIVFNAAKFGNTLTKGISKLHSDIIMKKPDIVLIEFGGNDCDFHWEEIALRPTEQHQPKTDFNTFGTVLKDTVSSLKSNRIIPVLVTLPPLDADRYFNWISKSCSNVSSNILSWLGSVTKIYWWQEKYNSAIVSIARETKTRLIDVRSAFLQSSDYTKLICVDGIHPNREGHKLIASIFLSYLSDNYKFLLR